MSYEDLLQSFYNDESPYTPSGSTCPIMDGCGRVMKFILGFIIKKITIGCIFSRGNEKPKFYDYGSSKWVTFE